MSEALTLSELAQILPLSRSTIQSLAKKGVLPAERHGRKTYISRAAVEAFLQRCMSLIRPQQPEVEIVIEGVAEAREHPRYRVKSPLAARIVTTDALIVGISENGARLHHERPLRIGSEGRFSFEIRGLQRVWVMRGRVTWSRLSTDGYVSGVTIVENGQAMEEAVACLQRLEQIEPDRRSLQRKRETARRKQALLAETRRVPQPDMEQAQRQATLIRVTMEHLRRDPIAAERWYARARYALAQESIRQLLPARIRERDEALAIWEALERKVDLRVVCRIVAET